MSDLSYVKRPCDECPWRVDAQPGRFTQERWTCLTETADTGKGSAELGSPIFACHKTQEGKDRACAGWLAQEGAGHVGVRAAVVFGRLPAEALSAKLDWPVLHKTLLDAAAHDLGYELEDF